MGFIPLKPLRRITIALLIVGCIFAQQSSDFAQVKARAEAGDAGAQVHTGEMLASGNGVSADESQAVEWFRRAAEQGNATGQYSMGEMYATGRGVAKDYRQAAAWWQKAAYQGEPRALSNLGALYLQGLGVKKNEKKAFGLTRRAADSGLATAQFGLGSMYAHGYGVKPDLQEAIHWYTRAVDQGDLPSMNNLSWLLVSAGDTAVRNPRKGLELAQRAVSASHEQNPTYLDTLAAAYFANSEFEKATAAERKAVALKSEDSSYRKNLQKYEDALKSSDKLPRFIGEDKPKNGNSVVEPPELITGPEPAVHGKLDEGKVVVELVVGTDGTVQDPKIVGSVSPELDRKALEAVRKWIFKPALKNGKPVKTLIRVEINFHQEGPP